MLVFHPVGESETGNRCRLSWQTTEGAAFNLGVDTRDNPSLASCGSLITPPPPGLELHPKYSRGVSK